MYHCIQLNSMNMHSTVLSRCLGRCEELFICDFSFEMETLNRAISISIVTAYFIIRSMFIFSCPAFWKRFDFSFFFRVCFIFALFSMEFKRNFIAFPYTCGVVAMKNAKKKNKIAPEYGANQNSTFASIFRMDLSSWHPFYVVA